MWSKPSYWDGWYVTRQTALPVRPIAFGASIGVPQLGPAQEPLKHATPRDPARMRHMTQRAWLI
jgi:hypothetical protein